MKEAFTFDDVLIVPRFSSGESRKNVNLESVTSERAFLDIGAKLPIISANMDTITGSKMAQTMLSYGAHACLHRFCSIEDNIQMFKESCVPLLDGDDEHHYTPMASVGLGNLELERAEALYAVGARTVIVDVANGAQLSVVNQVKELQKIFKGYVGIVVGNFASVVGIYDFLLHLGGNSQSIQGVKIGIGPGSLCSTRTQTGVGYPQLSAVLEITQYLKEFGIPTICDGGMKNPGDIAKALGAGASMVMLGGMLSGTDETPGEVLWRDREEPVMFKEPYLISAQGMAWINPEYKEVNVIREGYKKYRGSASKESYEAQGKTGTHRTAEGESTLIPYKGPVKDVLQNIEGGLRSAFTYVGARNLKEFQANVDFVKISAATQIENTPHALNRK